MPDAPAPLYSISLCVVLQVKEILADNFKDEPEGRDAEDHKEKAQILPPSSELGTPVLQRDCSGVAKTAVYLYNISQADPRIKVNRDTDSSSWHFLSPHKKCCPARYSCRKVCKI